MSRANLVIDAAIFLIERLNEFEQEIGQGEEQREWAGHVHPAISRLNGILNAEASAAEKSDAGKRISKEEAVEEALDALNDEIEEPLLADFARAAIAAADKWDAEQSGTETDAIALRYQAFRMPAEDQFWLASMVAENVGYVLAPEPEHPDSPHSQISPGLDSAIQDELNRPPAAIMKD